jgi:hypothetical protein
MALTKVNSGVLTLPVATSAEIKAGSIDTEAVSPSGLLASQGFTAFYQSPAQTITAAGALTLAHGLGREPIVFERYLVCITTGDGNFVAGDKAYINANYSTNSTTAAGCWQDANATNILIRFGSDANTFRVLDKTSGSAVTLTNARWQFYIRAWA